MTSSKVSLYRSYVYIGSLVGIPALAFIYGIYQLFTGSVSTFDIVMCLALGAIIELGVTIGYHRMLVHRSFEPNPAVRAFFLALGSMALQGPAISWASVHIKHHAYSDEEGDPHSPHVDDFIHAHFEWMMEMSFQDVNSIRARFGKRFDNDRMVQFFDRTFFMWTVISLLIPFILGGWSGLLWGGLIRIFLTSHVTWSVNSWCHVIGGRLFKTSDKSRNSFIVGLLAHGEGWHNNHHAFPTSAFHGMKWWQIDMSGYMIRILEKLRLVRNVVRIPREKMDARLESLGAAVKTVQNRVHDVANSAAELAHAARLSAGEAAQTVKTKIEESKEAITHQAEALKESAIHKADELAQKADELAQGVEIAMKSKDQVARA